MTLTGIISTMALAAPLMALASSSRKCMKRTGPSGCKGQPHHMGPEACPGGCHACQCQIWEAGLRCPQSLCTKYLCCEHQDCQLDRQDTTRGAQHANTAQCHWPVLQKKQSAHDAAACTEAETNVLHYGWLASAVEQFALASAKRYCVMLLRCKQHSIASALQGLAH